MRKIKYTFFCLLFCAPLFIIAQEVLEIKGNILEIGIFTDIKNSKYKEIAGTPYENIDFIPARINEIKKAQFIRINIVDQIVEVKTKHDKVIMLDLKYDFKIQLLDGSNKIYHTATFIDSGSRVKSFFEVIKQTERYTLYKQERKKYFRAQKEGSYQKKLPARFEDQEPVYFISDYKKASKSVIIIPKKRKKFMSFFGKSGQQINEYMKRNKLSRKDAGDLIQIFDFFFLEKS